MGTNMFDLDLYHAFLLITAIVFTLFGYFSGHNRGFIKGASGMIRLLEDKRFLKVKQRRTNLDGSEYVEYQTYDEDI